MNMWEIVSFTIIEMRNPFFLDSESGFNWTVISLFSSCRFV